MEKRNIFNVEEVRSQSKGTTVINARCVRQMAKHSDPYFLTMELDNNRVEARREVPTDAWEAETTKTTRIAMRRMTSTGSRMMRGPCVPMILSRNTLFGFRQPHRVGGAAA